jgi:hypothetical protein
MTRYGQHPGDELRQILVGHGDQVAGVLVVQKGQVSDFNHFGRP